MVSLSRRGLIDWFIQRGSAIYMFFYIVVAAIYFFKNPQLDYFTWLNTFSSLSVRVFTLLFVVSLLAHAWVGIWTVLTDYVKSGLLRAVLNMVVFFALIGFFFAALLILWSV